MKLFQPGPARDAGTSTRNAPPALAKAARAPPSAPAPGAPAVARQDATGAALRQNVPASATLRPCAAVIDTLLPGSDPTERQGLALVLADLLTKRLHTTWRALLSAHEPLCRRLPGSADAFDAEAAVASLTASLEPASIVALLAANGALQGPAVLAAVLAHPAPDLRETALDALLGPVPSTALDQACRAVCIGQLVAALDRLSAKDGQRPDWRRQLEAPPAGAERPLLPRHEDATEAALLAALRRGDNRAAIDLLAAAALVPVESIDIAIGLRSRRGMVSLAWKAGFSMQAAVLLQSQLAEIACGSVLTATEDGGCPLSRGEMAWQIGFLARKLM